MSELVDAHDWSSTSLGPRAGWPLELRATLEIVLSSRFPMVFWWGPDLIQIYNDAYLPIIGKKHPAALGQSAETCWREIWDTIGPQINSIYDGGPATWNEDVLLDINRDGFVGELYFTWSYSPLPDARSSNGVGGVLCTVQETTEKVIGERRILLLRDLAAHGTEAKSAEQECAVAVATLERYARSVPFALIYLLDESNAVARLAASCGIAADDAQTRPPAIDLSEAGAVWPLAEAQMRGALVRIPDLGARVRSVPPGPWPEPPSEAVVVPIQSGIAHDVAGFLVAGVNPRERFDDRYGTFFELIAGQIASAISNARAYESERRRAEALAELDRQKIAFFSNVSHEFRTPLTLMLGPLGQLLRDADDETAPLLETAHRNALRLLKLVNTLLEFARLEAGRTEAAFADTDLSEMTTELCGLFESAMQDAGLRFVIDVDAGVRALVDRSMWEMIVLNLLSNALKYTHEGSVAVTLREHAGAAELSVRDSGIGIPESDLPHVFERFRRVSGARARSHEGSGIGLSLVDELVRLHGGSSTVESVLGQGSTFIVTIPLGRAHVDPGRIVSVARPATHASVVDQYLADVDATIVRAGPSAPATRERTKATRVLVADDNGDLRAYLTRILSPHHDVVAVRDGLEALAVLRSQPIDLVVSDVMMPEMDGFALIREVRNDSQLATVPFIMLSARAGESSAIEGLSTGADDYLVKPFSAEELLARVDAQLNAAAIRERATQDLRANEERFRMLAASMPHIVLEGDAARDVTFLSAAYTAYTGRPTETGYGRGWLDHVHPDDAESTAAAWDRALRSGEEFAADFRLRRSDGAYRWHVGRALPQRNVRDQSVRWTGTITDVHDMRRSVEERAFLSEASRILAQSLDLETTLQNLAAFTIPLFADWCQIDLTTADGAIRTVAIAHRDPARQALAADLAGRVHLNPAAESGSPYAIRTGRSNLIEEIGSEPADTVDDPRELAIYRRLGLCSSAVMPLVADGRTLGAISVVYGDSGRRYTSDDLPMLEELARRAGVAVMRATEFEREHRVAQSFQEASLPSALPNVFGANFDAVYVPATDEAQVGGDWYDAVRLADGRVVISIGDVAGKGLRAAVTMGNMRQIIRGIAQVHADPALMLDAADRALRLEHPDHFVTAFVGVFDPVGGTFAFASAGHPPPMVRYPDGSIELLDNGGLPLGLRYATREPGRQIPLPPGSYVVFYTDGLTESARRPADGEDRVRDLLRDGSLLHSRHPAHAIKDAIFHDAPPQDDVAVLVMGVRAQGHEDHAPRVIERRYFDASDAAAGQAARRAFTAGLRDRAADPASVFNAEVVFGELVGNAARYAPGPVEVTVDWSGPSPVLHVLDRGPGVHHIPALPRDVYSESGRGLYIIAELSDDFTVSKRPNGGSHARAVISLSRSLRPRLTS